MKSIIFNLFLKYCKILGYEVSIMKDDEYSNEYYSNYKILDKNEDSNKPRDNIFNISTEKIEITNDKIKDKNIRRINYIDGKKMMMNNNPGSNKIISEKINEIINVINHIVNQNG